MQTHRLLLSDRSRPYNEHSLTPARTHKAPAGSALVLGRYITVVIQGVVVTIPRSQSVVDDLQGTITVPEM